MTPMKPVPPMPPTAAVVLIGDEILSGRTQDQNLQYIARWLADKGIDLKQARIVGDAGTEIADAVNALRARYDHVFTTGGIGPTHDDITADAIAAAFGVPIDHDPAIVRRLSAYFTRRGYQATPARLRMARLPQGAQPIDNPVSCAPGFRLANVYVLAGVPKIMQAMLESLSPQLPDADRVLSQTVTINHGEGDVGGPLEAIQRRFATVALGSYPFEREGGFGCHIVLRSRDAAALESAAGEVRALAAALDERK